jgi:hypothetical protein
MKSVSSLPGDGAQQFNSELRKSAQFLSLVLAQQVHQPLPVLGLQQLLPRAQRTLRKNVLEPTRNALMSVPIPAPR